MSRRATNPKPTSPDESVGKLEHARSWVVNSFALTAPSDFRGSIVCIDDCPNCALFKKGCAGACVRWDNFVCRDCPCLGSKYADKFGEPETVNARTETLAPPDPRLLQIRELRRNLADGVAVPYRGFTVIE